LRQQGSLESKREKVKVRKMDLNKQKKGIGKERQKD